MAKVKLRETILKGNTEKMVILAETYGLNLIDFLYMLANVDWYCLSRDVVMQKKIEGRKIPKELEFLDKPKIIQIDKGNTERLEVYIEPETDLNPDLLNGIKLIKGGKK
jgi:hypothetical protein